MRYPAHGRAALHAAGVSYGGWLPNHEAPRALRAHRVTVHVPRRPYVRALPGIPTIRPFEALATGTPLGSAPRDDDEGSSGEGRTTSSPGDGAEMRRHLRAVLEEPGLARALADEGLATIRARHTCAHRVDELLDVLRQLG